MTEWEKDKDSYGKRPYKFEEGGCVVRFSRDPEVRAYRLDAPNLEIFYYSEREPLFIETVGEGITLDGLIVLLKTGGTRNMDATTRSKLQTVLDKLNKKDYKSFDELSEDKSAEMEYLSREAAHDDFMKQRRREYGSGLSDGLEEGLAFTDEVEKD